MLLEPVYLRNLMMSTRTAVLEDIGGDAVGARHAVGSDTKECVAIEQRALARTRAVS